MDIWEKPAGGEPVAVVRAPGMQNQPSLSADGRWLSYKSNATGRHEIWIRAYAGSGPGQQISMAMINQFVNHVQLFPKLLALYHYFSLSLVWAMKPITLKLNLTDSETDMNLILLWLRINIL